MTASAASVDALPQRICEAIDALDAALGRPPFPNPAREEVLSHAREVGDRIEQAREKNRLSSLAACKSVTTTLPVLCAALREGSEGKAPCPRLTELLLRCLAPVCNLSTYPLQPILRDMEACMSWHSTALFAFTLASGALTDERMRRFLGLPPPRVAEKTSTGATAGKAKGKKAGKQTGTGADATPPAEVERREPLPKALLKAMLTSSLGDTQRQLLVSTFNTSAKFFKLVGDDGELAECILDVYGHVLLPTLKPSSLLPCLDEHLLDYFVDLVHVHDERMLLLTEHQLVTTTAVREWSDDRLRRLCVKAKSRAVSSADGYGSLVTAVFLCLVVKERGERGGTGIDGEAMLNLQDLWEAVFTAAWWTYVGAHEAILQRRPETDPRPVQTGGCFASEDSIELVGSTLHLRHAEEERWLRPLSILASALSPAIMARPSCEGRFSGCADGVTTPLRDAVRRFASMVLVPSFLGKSEPRRRRALQSAKATTLPPQQHAKPGKGSSKGAASKKKPNHKSSSAAEPAVPLAPAAPPTVVTFVAYLQQSAGALFLCSLLNPTTLLPDGEKAWLALSQAFQFCATFALPQPMSGALWGSFLDTACLAGWQLYHGARALGKDPEADQQSASPAFHEGLVTATKAISNPMWLTPFVLLAVGSATSQQRPDGPRWMDDFFTDSLVNASLTAFLLKRGARDGPADAEGSRSHFQQLLHPLAPALVLGLLAEVLHRQGQGLQNAVSRFSKADAIEAMLPYLDSVLEKYLSENETDRGRQESQVAPSADDMAPIAMAGIQRLREGLSHVYQLQRDETQRKQEAAAEERRVRVLQKIEEAAVLAEDRARFAAQQEAILAGKRREAAVVRQECERLQRLRQERVEAECRQREAKKRQMLATLRAQQTTSKAQREAEQRRRAERYRERMASLFRVSAFLEHLELVPSRVMDIRERLGTRLDTISPDELLEFVVTGTASIPADMRDREAGEEEEETPALEEQRAPLAPVKDFWADVAREDLSPATTPDRTREGVRVAVSEGKRLQPTAPPVPASPTAPPAVVHSFHFRATPLLNLFCYSGGSEYGDLPEPLPALKLSLASRVLPKAELDASGFASVQDGFLEMKRRGLVTLDDGRVGLSVLGFRYHFPYHDPDGMLEVRVRRNRERVLQRVVSAESDSVVPAHKSVHHVTGNQGSEEHEDEEEEESGYDESGGDDVVDPNQILPDVEFGI